MAGHRDGSVAPSSRWNPQTVARVSSQHRDAGCIRPPVLLRPRRSSRPSGTTDELLDCPWGQAELLRGPCRLRAAAARVHVESELASRVADGELIEHAVRGAEQT